MLTIFTAIAAKASAIAAVARGRSWRWPARSREKLAANPLCEVCGRKATAVHHILPFWKFRHLELAWDNLASVCRWCHYSVGHGCDPKWKAYNPKFAELAAALRAAYVRE